jgi:hypothetical protein
MIPVELIVYFVQIFGAAYAPALTYTVLWSLLYITTWLLFSSIAALNLVDDKGTLRGFLIALPNRTQPAHGSFYDHAVGIVVIVKKTRVFQYVLVAVP